MPRAKCLAIRKARQRRIFLARKLCAVLLPRSTYVARWHLPSYGKMWKPAHTITGENRKSPLNHEVFGGVATDRPAGSTMRLQGFRSLAPNVLGNDAFLPPTFRSEAWPTHRQNTMAAGRQARLLTRDFVTWKKETPNKKICIHISQT